MKILRYVAGGLLCAGLAAAAPPRQASAAPGTAASRTAEEDANRKLVVDFYTRVLLNLDADAADEYIGEPYIQHNPAKQNGLAPLKAYIARLKASGLHPASTIEHAYVDGDIVILHVHAKKDPDDRGLAVVDIFRVKGGKIVEHWDVVQEIPETIQNRNGMF